MIGLKNIYTVVLVSEQFGDHFGALNGAFDLGPIHDCDGGSANATATR
jgi:hypothetical protein